MLDDLKYIHQRDGNDALGVAEKQWQQLSLRHDTTFSYKDIENVVLAGMGGSALPAVFLQSWGVLVKPFEIVRDYSLPAYVDERTLAIISSYSGNTEETLSALDDAKDKGAKIAVVAAGGKLAERAEAEGLPLLKIPTGIQPRMSAFYFLATFTQILCQVDAAEPASAPELAAAGEWLKDQTAAWRPDVATKDNPAKKMAMELAGKTVIMYSGPKLFGAANKWKIGMNENAKNLAWSNQYSEFNHNEFIGWSSHPVDKPFAVVEIRSDLEHPRIQKRFTVSEKMLSGRRPVPEVVRPEGDSVIKQLLWASNMGDYVSIYLALLNGLNPTPVELVEKFKAELDK